MDRRVWARVRAAGKVTKCHAGEFDGAHRVREAITELGVTRIQHGVRAIEDPSVVALAAEQGVTFDVCPISNVRLQVFPSIAEHPIRRLGEAGVRCTVSTDDPLCFGNTVRTSTKPWPRRPASGGPSSPGWPRTAGRSPACPPRPGRALRGD